MCCTRKNIVQRDWKTVMYNVVRSFAVTSHMTIDKQETPMQYNY